MNASLNPPPDARRFRRAFDRAAATYDGAAEFQRAIAARLAALIGTHTDAQRAADLGCGTGLSTALLAPCAPHAQWFALDFAPAMLAAARQRVPAAAALAGDLQRLPFADASVDLLCSSLALQWCEPALALAEAARVLRPGGTFALATLGPGTLAELAQAFAGVDAHEHVMHFTGLPQLAEAAAAAGLTVRSAHGAPLTLHRDSVIAIVRELKALGANGVGAGRRRAPLGRAAWREIEARYEALRTSQGLPVTYAALYLTLEKP